MYPRSVFARLSTALAFQRPIILSAIICCYFSIESFITTRSIANVIRPFLRIELSDFALIGAMPKL
ncbi:hypothetical protein EHN06_08950 [Marinobacter sp. NP-4(2019)]|uniref:hypothetical protein n=1 Tax=Marinobacter sp. NP-4(2019) TaxID=2488665 RepID=UPI000FC3CAEE|nr:hypothetical protein [Marinobacter sp. NP-4(2019)]AZT83656.1 hypothetical protein EHN06_08950 [Marinobacter sp. NP-4(2019)]